MERNTLKRRLRELARTRLIPTIAPVDLVIRALPSTYESSFAELTEEIDRLRAQLGTHRSWTNESRANETSLDESQADETGTDETRADRP